MSMINKEIADFITYAFHDKDLKMVSKEDEFTSFVLGMYNAAGPGQAMDEDVRMRTESTGKQVDIKYKVSHIFKDRKMW